VSQDLLLPTVVVLLCGFGCWLLLPHRHGKIKSRTTHAFGAVLAMLGLFLLATFYTPPGPLLTSLFFYAFATASLAGAILTVSSKNPVYSALWFASVILSTSGLFLLAGAQFLAAGTIIVYAGAIIVTFLFVIMLAQSEGQAVYDRMARAPGAATFSGFALFWAVFYALIVVSSPNSSIQVDPVRGGRLIPASHMVGEPGPAGKPGLNGHLQPNDTPALVLNRAIRPTAKLVSEASPSFGTPPSHVAGLGGTLFTDHILAVELAGALLFVALIGAISIATPKPPTRPAERGAVSAGDPAQARASFTMPV
jgi:NADH-quinone oxidoreductase subunit J